MNKKITMYELLGMVKDGEAPKKIKYKNIIYELSDNEIWADEVYSDEGKGYIKLNFKHIESLNNYVEILDDEDMEIEDINISSFDNMQEIGTKLGKAYRQFFEGFSKGWKDTEEDK